MRMIEVVDERDYAALTQLFLALQATYRDELGPVPESKANDPSIEEQAGE